MKSKRILHVMNSGIFPYKILLCAGFTYEEICKELKKQKCHEWVAGISQDKKLIEESPNNAMKRTVKKGKLKATLFYIIFRDTFDFSDWDMIKLAHECLHICQFMLPDILNRNDEYESEAYLHSHLMQQALQKFREK